MDYYSTAWFPPMRVTTTNQHRTGVIFSEGNIGRPRTGSRSWYKNGFIIGKRAGLVWGMNASVIGGVAGGFRIVIVIIRGGWD